jgi:hypothetical protein
MVAFFLEDPVFEMILPIEQETGDRYYVQNI